MTKPTEVSSNDRGPIEHELKAWPPLYARTADGSKTFELRWNDRDYRAGDTLHIIEFNPESECYTGCSLRRLVTYVMEGGQFGLEPGWVALGLAHETRASAWQPIETAPKDRVVMLWVPEFPGFPAGAWFGMWSWAQWWELRAPLQIGGKQVYVKDVPCPTHWQPWPEPPESAVNGRADDAG